jgi:hypothetical protein
MNVCILPRQLPEMRSLTTDQQRGVMRRFFSERYFVFCGLAGVIGMCVAYILSDMLQLSFWPRGVLMAAFYLLASGACSQYEMRRLRPKIADYVFIHFRQTSA